VLKKDIRKNDIMFEERLLERIGNLEVPAKDKTGTVVTRAIASVIGHLQKMLNTREGNVSIAEDYGMPDFTDCQGESLADTCRRMRGVIKQFVEKYEPRLDNVHITFEPEDNNALCLRFKLEGVLVRENKVPVMLETVVDSSGKVVVTD
jgi:type VI secretion system protein